MAIMYTKQQKREIGRNLALGMTQQDAFRKATGSNSPNAHKFAYQYAKDPIVVAAKEYWLGEFGKKALATADMLEYETLNLLQFGNPMLDEEGKEIGRVSLKPSEKIAAMRFLKDLRGLGSNDKAKGMKDAAAAMNSLASLSNSIAESRNGEKG